MLQPLEEARRARCVFAALLIAVNAAHAGVLNDLSVADVENQGGATVNQNGAVNNGQYGIVIPAGFVPQEIAVIISGNAVGNSFNASQWDWRLNTDNATLSAINAGPQYTVPLGPPLRANGQAVGTVTTPEGWIVYNAESFHSKSGQSTNTYDDNHLLFFRVASLDSNSPSFNPTFHAFFATSAVSRFISIQSHNDSIFGIPQLSNDTNAPVSVYRDGFTPAYVAGPRPLGAAMDAGQLGSLLQIPPPAATVLAATATVSATTFTLNFTNTGPGRMCRVIRSATPDFTTPRTTVTQFYAETLTATVLDTVTNPAPNLFWRLERTP